MENHKLKKIAESIYSELLAASNNNSSSIPYIRNPLTTSKDEKSDKKIQALVIGGSVFKKAIFERRNNKLRLISSVQKEQPAFHSKDNFLAFILNEIDPEINDIGINFAYPLEPLMRNSKLDGILLSGMKENEFEGLVGERIGDMIERSVYEKNGKRTNAYVANDAICLLLSGQPFSSKEHLAAGVIGTGINFAFFSKPEEAINTEAANFDKFPLSKEAENIDSTSASPSRALFEKEIAGAYLYQHYNYYLKSHNLDFPSLSSTNELANLARTNSKEGEVALNLLKRSAQLSAALIAGLAIFKKSDLTCIIEGSLFWKGYLYKETVETTVNELVPEFSVTFIKVSDSPLFGAAHLIP